MKNNSLPIRTIKSFVRRNRHLTLARKLAINDLWPLYGLSSDHEIDIDKIFKRCNTKTILEIGFGMGDSLFTMARENPEINFIGIEVHTPGVGALFTKLLQDPLKNIRVFIEDADFVLSKAIPEQSIDKILLFFPDPWPKTRHHKRRLVQLEFAKLILSRLKTGGQFHLVTDSKDYAMHAIKIMEQIPEFFNLAKENKFVPRAAYRSLTKFEKRALKSGHEIWEVMFEKVSVIFR